MFRVEKGGHVSHAGYRSSSGHTSVIGHGNRSEHGFRQHRLEQLQSPCLKSCLNFFLWCLFQRLCAALLCQRWCGLRIALGSTRRHSQLMPPWEVDVTTLRQHVRPAGERRSKARENPIRVQTSKPTNFLRHSSPLAKRSKVIEMTSSEEEEAAPECEHSGGMSEREQSWRYVTHSLPSSILS